MTDFPDAPHVYLFIGDSITADDSDGSLGHGYVAQIAAALGERGASIEVINRGIAGDTAADLERGWQGDCLAVAPTLVSVLIGIDGAQAGATSEKDAIDAYRQSLQNVLRRTREQTDAALVLLEPFIAHTGAATPEREAAMSGRRAVVRELAERFGAILVPTQEVFDKAARDASAEDLLHDGVRLTARGHRVIADVWLARVDAHVRGGTVVAGTLPSDDRGRPAQLHGAGLARVGDRWYAWGEDKTRGDRFTAVAVYSSPDLATWRFEGNALEAGEGDLAPDRIVERPKALQRPDGKWVLFLHLDSADYSDARVGFAIGDDPAGPFTYLHGERPFGNISRDIGVYQEDGVGYLLSEDRDHGLHIYRLTDDYLGVHSIVATLRQQDRPEFGYESPTLVRHDGRYFLFGSDLTGWDLNDNKYATATSLEGPWSPWRDIAPAGSATFQSQVSTVIPLAGDVYAYLGDRWQPDALFHSPIVLLPLHIDGGTAELRWRDTWTPVPAFATP